MFMYFFPCNLFIAGHKANISAQCGFVFLFFQIFFPKGSIAIVLQPQGSKPTSSGDKQLSDRGIEFTEQYRQNQLVVFVADCGRCELSSHMSGSLAKHKTTSIRLIIIITPIMLELERDGFTLALQGD